MKIISKGTRFRFAPIKHTLQAIVNAPLGATEPQGNPTARAVRARGAVKSDWDSTVYVPPVEGE